jgi:UPF0755 protein
MVRYTDPNGLLIDIQNLGHFAARLKYEGIGTGKCLLQKLEHWCIEPSNVLRNMTEIVTNKREVKFVRLNAHNRANPFDCFPVHQITPDAVNGVGWINDDTAGFQDIDYLPDLSCLRVYRMNCEKVCCHGLKLHFQRKTKADICYVRGCKLHLPVLAEFIIFEVFYYMKPNKRLIIFLFLSILGISFVFYGYQILYTPNILVDKEDRLLIVRRGDTFETIQKKLHEGDYVQDLISFSFLARLTDYDENVKEGRFVLRKNMTNLQAIRTLRSGNQNPVRITFNNVRLISELSEKITKNLSITPEEFQASLIQFAKNNPYGFNKDNVISMFIPNTYEVYYNVSSEGLIEKMYEEYAKFWNDERLEKAKKIGLTPFEVSTLASIVQAESIRDDEAPIIASLYLNRLKKGIALQADPTLVFAAQDFTLKRVLNEHKQIDSPYNTYKYPGLPPGPINMPHIKSIEAVLNHAETDYYYMCAKEDFSGRHNFTNSYDEHMKNAAKYQRALTIEQQKAARLNK